MGARKKKESGSKGVSFKPDRVSIIRDRRIGLPNYGSTLISVEVSGQIPEDVTFDQAAEAADEIARGWIKPKLDEVLGELEREEGAYGLKK